HAQSIKLANLTACRYRQTEEFACHFGRAQFVFGIIHREGLRNSYRFCSLILEFAQEIGQRIEAQLRIEELMKGGKQPSAAKTNCGKISSSCSQPAVLAACHSENAYRRQIAFQKGVGGLRGAVRYEGYICRLDLGRIKQLMQRLDYSFCHSLFCAMS